MSRTRSWHIWWTVFHARQKRMDSLMLASLLAFASSSILGNSRTGFRFDRVKTCCVGVSERSRLGGGAGGLGMGLMKEAGSVQVGRKLILRLPAATTRDPSQSVPSKPNM